MALFDNKIADVFQKPGRAEVTVDVVHRIQRAVPPGKVHHGVTLVDEPVCGVQSNASAGAGNEQTLHDQTPILASRLRWPIDQGLRTPAGESFPAPTPRFVHHPANVRGTIAPVLRP